MLIVNTTKHLGTALTVEPFGEDGAMRFVPINGDKPGQPFILDAHAVAELVAELLAR